MFVDASAIVAILAREPEWRDFVDRIDAAPVVMVSAIVVYEAVLAVARIRAHDITVAEAAVAEFLTSIGAEAMPIDGGVGKAAIDAFARYGKGRHPAALNMGDCFAYACAKAQALPILAKGDDFARTDVGLA